MRMHWSVVCLSMVVGSIWAGTSAAAEVGRDAPGARPGLPGGGFPPEDLDFLIINTGYSVCLSAVSDPGVVGEGLPCEWEAPGMYQRWRYRHGQLVNVASGTCLRVPVLVPCEGEERIEVSYELLAERLVLTPPRLSGEETCLVVSERARAGDAFPRYPVGLAPLGSEGCGAESFTSKWVLVPLPR